MTVVVFAGQGSQFVGMGAKLFDEFDEITQRASDRLGYDIRRLCLEDPDKKLRQTQFTQPAVYVVNALAYYKLREETLGNRPISHVAGHSLGEYNALVAAGMLDFEVGLELVAKRAALMAQCGGGAMLALFDCDAERAERMLADEGFEGLDVANYNSPSQVVVAGLADDVDRLMAWRRKQGLNCFPLNVSGAFHSRYMSKAAAEFEPHVRAAPLLAPAMPVLANATAELYETSTAAQLLAGQIARPVRWMQTIQEIHRQGGAEFFEVSPHLYGSGKKILEPMITATLDALASAVERPASTAAPVEPTSALSSATAPTAEAPTPINSPAEVVARAPSASARVGFAGAQREAGGLGSIVFRERHGVEHAYVLGAMYRGVASVALVRRAAAAGLLSFFGAGGLSVDRVEQAIRSIQADGGPGGPYGSNLLSTPTHPELERGVVDVYLRLGVRTIEAAAYIEMSEALVHFRLCGLAPAANGGVECRHRVLAKVSRPEVARSFMSPAPELLVRRLLESGLITGQQAELSRRVPMSHDICVEADSGGHTDGGVATVLFPAMVNLRDRIVAERGYDETICIGLAGGLGTPEALAAAFIMGADFVLTGSINQCTVEAGTSDRVKDLLNDVDVQDTAYAPAGDMFEGTAQVQVLRKGVFFPSRASKLRALYGQYESLEQIPPTVLTQIEKNYFKEPWRVVWDRTKARLLALGRTREAEDAERMPKRKMAMVFRAYFHATTELALNGDADQANYQVHTGPALGAFNRWAEGTALSSWRARHADEIGLALMAATADHLQDRFTALEGAIGPRRAARDQATSSTFEVAAE